jgi:EAL domain-containing protein (putative c-di-GMP-specific phosphodiesterase class I)
MVNVTADDILGGLRNDEFILYYQPKASLITNRIVGAEALVRWRRPDGTVLLPGTFVPVAEREGLIKRLTLQLLPQLIGDLVDHGLAHDLCVSFNVSTCDLEDGVLTGAILDAIDTARLPPAALELEITETQALRSGPEVLDNMRALSEAGVGLAMDDYGVGYSSMDTLSQWPFTTIKLDQGIVERMLDSAKNATIVRSSIRLAHELGLEVVAEGVETVPQHDFLVEAGCRIAQGFLLSRPLPLTEFKAFCAHPPCCRGLPVGLVHMAIIDHVQWRREMASYAIQRSCLPPDSPLRKTGTYPTLGLTECGLGKWYAGEGRRFSDLPMFRDLDAPHRGLHDVGARIVARIQDGAGPDEMAPLLCELKQVSVTLIRILEDLEDSGLDALFRLQLRAIHH